MINWDLLFRPKKKKQELYIFRKEQFKDGVWGLN